MKRITTSYPARGYILQEIIVGLVIFAIAMLPILRGLKLLPELGAAIGEQSRREAWRSAADQAVLQGVDPAQTRLMHSVTHADEPYSLAGTLARTDLQSRPGRPQISVLSASYDATAEDRAYPTGFEIGAGSVPVPPRNDPLPPLPPIKLSAPSLNPSNGSLVPILALSPASLVGDPFTLSIQASGAGSDVIHLRESSPLNQEQAGLGAATLLTDAVQLAESVKGQAWAEFSGDPSQDIPVALGDGRTRWLVPSGARMQVYEPSDPVDFILGLDIGRPAYSLSGVEYASGDTVPVDYVEALAVDAGTDQAQITYPTEVRRRFGDQWARVSPSYAWSFGPFPGDSSAGNTVSFFRPSGRAIWAATQTLTATPASGLPGLRLLSGSWTVERKATLLQPPERIASYYDGLTDAPGSVEFDAPVLSPLGQRMGRPEVNAVESVNESLSVPLVP